MNTVQRVAVMIAATGLIATVVAPSAKSASVLDSIFSGVSKWEKTAQGRG